ncbi:MAG: tetratricopeptide repeat protein [Nitrospinae bacterium]|nr:tetratricopeptide repeat protein [Nitrospinota bacterium]
MHNNMNNIILFSKKVLFPFLITLIVVILLNGCAVLPLFNRSKTVEEIKEVDMMGSLMIEIKQLQAQQEATSAKIKELEEMVNSMEPNFQEMMMELNERIEYIESKISTARIDLDDLIKEINKLKVKKELKLEELEEGSPHSSTYPIPLETMIPVNKEREIQKGYARALNFFNDKRYEDSLELLQSLSIEDSPEDLRDNIIFWIGDCYYKLKRYNEAIGEFYRIIEEYPHSSKVIEAKEKIGFSYYMMDADDRALKIFKEILNKTPPPDIKTRVKEKIKEIELRTKKG